MMGGGEIVVEYISDFNIDDFFLSSDLFFKDDGVAAVDSGSSSPSSCIEDLPSTSNDDLSLWIRGLEEKMLNDDDVDNNSNDFPIDDDFFADLDLPAFKEQQVDDQSDHIEVRVSIDDEQNKDQDNNSNYDEDQFSDYLLDVLTDDQSDESKVVIEENSSPESHISSDDSAAYAYEKEGIAATTDAIAAVLGKDKADEKENIDDGDASEDKDDDDPVAKKRKRQMRNRDAAVKSRERKKMYVKDLEMKSKYMEGECIRLQRLLQCCAAENHALHFQLQEKAFSASRTKQESAVLLLESLLLGSLLWFLGIVGLFSPLEMHLQLPAGLLVNVGSNRQEVVDLVALGRAKSKKIGLGSLRLFFNSKRCKASRSKMKTVTSYGAVVA